MPTTCRFFMYDEKCLIIAHLNISPMMRCARVPQRSVGGVRDSVSSPVALHVHLAHHQQRVGVLIQDVQALQPAFCGKAISIDYPQVVDRSVFVMTLSSQTVAVFPSGDSRSPIGCRSQHVLP